MKRFKRWCTSVRGVQTGTIEKTLPPIDVVMVWHAYLLNPMYVDETVCRECLLILLVSWYAEDTMRVPTLSSLPLYTEYLTVHLVSSYCHSRWSSLIELVAGISRASSSAHGFATSRSSAVLARPNDDTL